MRSTTRVIAFAIALTTPACATYDWGAAVRQQASFDHHCPPQQIAIVDDDGNGMARSVHVIVCGQPRLYRDIGGTRMFMWQDMTQTTGGEAAPAGAVPSAPSAPPPPPPPIAPTSST